MCKAGGRQIHSKILFKLLERNIYLGISKIRLALTIPKLNSYPIKTYFRCLKIFLKEIQEKP